MVRGEIILFGRLDFNYGLCYTIRSKMKFVVRQHYSGYIERTVEAETKDDAENQMLNIECNFDELMDANWDDPVVVGEAD